MTPSHSDNAHPSESVIAQDAGLDIKDLIGILRRRKKVILATVLLLTSLAVLVGLQLTQKYTATALVMIDPSKSNIVDVESVIQGLGTDASTVESQIRVISSRFQLERLADDLGIFDDPEFNAALRNPDRDVPDAGRRAVRVPARPGCPTSGWWPPGWQPSRSMPPTNDIPLCSTRRPSSRSGISSRSRPKADPT